MSLWVVVGGQYGSEGKGKISAYITLQEDIDICIRCGGPNSGHSFVAEDGTTKLVRQLPTGFVNPKTRLMIPAGALVDLDVLRAEIDALGLGPDRVRVDRNAMIIEEADKENERQLQLRERLSSTLCGVGSAVARRALRDSGVRLAYDAAREISWLAPLIGDIAELANAALDRSEKVLVEGTQGFGLSLYHTSEYPKATSRDTTAAAFLSEVGLSPRLVSEVIVVLRTFPIRVAGDQAGTLHEEISWEVLQKESGSPHALEEVTSVTKKTRRIGRFDWKLAERAIRINRPTRLAINGLDYLCYDDRNAESFDTLSRRSTEFVRSIEDRFGVPVQWVAARPELQAVLATSSPLHTETRPLQLC